MTPTQSPPDAWLATWHRLNVGWFTLSAAGGTSTPSSQPQTQKQLPDTTKFTIFLSFFPLFDRYTGASTKRGLPIPSVLVASLFFQSTSANTQKRTEDTAEEEERRRRRERGRHTGWWSTRRKVSNHMGRWVAGMHTALSVTHKHTLHFALERGTRVIAHNITHSLSISPVHPSPPLFPSSSTSNRQVGLLAATDSHKKHSTTAQKRWCFI